MSILNFKEVGVQRMEDQASRKMMDLKDARPNESNDIDNISQLS